MAEGSFYFKKSRGFVYVMLMLVSNKLRSHINRMTFI